MVPCYMKHFIYQNPLEASRPYFHPYRRTSNVISLPNDDEGLKLGMTCSSLIYTNQNTVFMCLPNNVYI